MKSMLKRIALVMVITILLCVPVFAGGDQPNLPDTSVPPEEV